MISIIHIDGDDITIFKDTDTLRWHCEAWQFTDKNGAPPKLFTIDGGRVEPELIDPQDEHSEILLTLGESTTESIAELTSILCSWVTRWHAGYHPKELELVQLVKILPHWPEE